MFILSLAVARTAAICCSADCSVCVWVCSRVRKRPCTVRVQVWDKIVYLTNLCSIDIMDGCIEVVLSLL